MAHTVMEVLSGESILNIDLAYDILESDDVSAGENVTLQVTLEPKPQRIGVQIRGSKMKVNTPKR